MKELLDLAAGITAAHNRIVAAEQRVDHLERILRQAVMTHGGKLLINPMYADEAKLASGASLWIGSGGVQLCVPASIGSISGDRILTKAEHPRWGVVNTEDGV